MTPDEIDDFNPWAEFARILRQSDNNLERLANGMSDNDNTFTPDIGDRVRVTGGYELERLGYIGAEAVVEIVFDEPYRFPYGDAGDEEHYWLVRTEKGRVPLYVSDMELIEDDVVSRIDATLQVNDDLLDDVAEIITAADYELRAQAVREAFGILRDYGRPLEIADVLDLADFMVDGGAA